LTNKSIYVLVNIEILEQKLGEDGYYLLKILLAPETPKYIKKIESIEILRQVWLQQTDDPEFKKNYNQRAGIEGTISQGIHAFS
jgi:hypothetical protein